MNRKIEAMHARFGVLSDKRCEDCSNLIKGYCGNTFVRKCTVYGATHSEASDWRKKYVACGMFNKEWRGGKIIEVCKRKKGRENPLCKPVFQYDKDGHLIKRWETSFDIEASLGYDRKVIIACCGGHKPSYRGFVWRHY